MYDSYVFGWLVTSNICFCSWYITVNSYFKFLLKTKIYYLLFLVNIYKIDYLYLLLFNFSLFLYICSAIFNHLHFCLSFKYLLLLCFLILLRWRVCQNVSSLWTTRGKFIFIICIPWQTVLFPFDLITILWLLWSAIISVYNYIFNF